jgi:hypothetical protein
MDVNYLTLGYDCSPASALQQLHLRSFALPFDWVVSSVNNLKKCFETNFVNFHQKLYVNSNKTRLIDDYGFEFPHDYPLDGMDHSENNIGEGIIGEEKGKVITDNWKNYYENVIEKYNRRIQRFNNIINDSSKPIIVLCRYSTDDVLKLQKILLNHFKRTDIYFINSSQKIFENDKIKNVYTEKNNHWNDIEIWKQGLDDIIKKINSKTQDSSNAIPMQINPKNRNVSMRMRMIFSSNL